MADEAKDSTKLCYAAMADEAKDSTKLCYAAFAQFMITDEDFRVAVIKNPQAALEAFFIEYNPGMIEALKNFNYDDAKRVAKAFDDFKGDCDLYAC